MTQIPILILAAGAASRMGGVDKLLLEIAGEALLRRTARIACAATDAEVRVALPVAPHPRHTALTGLPVTKVPVPEAAEGMNASLRRVMADLPNGTDAVMILLADLPEMTESDLKKVLQYVDTKSETLIWRGVTADGKPGHPVVFASALFSELSTLSGDAGAQQVVNRHADKVMLVPLPAQHARRDLDTPQDWAAWRSEHED